MDRRQSGKRFATKWGSFCTKKKGRVPLWVTVSPGFGAAMQRPSWGIARFANRRQAVALRNLISRNCRQSAPRFVVLPGWVARWQSCHCIMQETCLGGWLTEKQNARVGRASWVQRRTWALQCAAAYCSSSWCRVALSSSARKQASMPLRASCSTCSRERSSARATAW